MTPADPIRFALAADPSPLRDIRITAVLGFRHVTRRPKFIGRNAKKDVHGIEGYENVVRLATDVGLQGIGFGNVSPEHGEKLIGLSLAHIWEATADGAPPLGRADHALFDLTGKALGKPIWALLGGEGPEWVPVYDTSLYFSDLLPENEGRGAACLIDELDEGLGCGHRAFKVKVGRGARWMDAEEGLARDIEVVRRLSEHAGPSIKLMADANDQYGPEIARRFLGEVGHLLVFAEEMFPEDIETCWAMRQWLRDRGLGTCLADGESEHDPAVHERLARAGALDVLQPDIRALGLGLQCALSRAVADLPHVSIAAHNWGSYLGTFKMLQLGRGIGNFLTAELDRMSSDLFDDGEWQLKEGRMRVPDTPGAGLTLREDVFRERYLPTAWIAGDGRAFA